MLQKIQKKIFVLVILASTTLMMSGCIDPCFGKWDQYC